MKYLLAALALIATPALAEPDLRTRSITDWSVVEQADGRKPNCTIPIESADANYPRACLVRVDVGGNDWNVLGFYNVTGNPRDRSHPRLYNPLPEVPTITVIDTTGWVKGVTKIRLLPPHGEATYYTTSEHTGRITGFIPSLGGRQLVWYDWRTGEGVGRNPTDIDMDAVTTREVEE